MKFHNQEHVGVYYSGQDFSSEAPVFFVDRAQAREWADAGKGWYIHHGQDLALVGDASCLGEIDARSLTGFAGPQESQVMGEPVMRANAEEQRWARRMTRSWHPGVAEAEHLESLRRYKALEGRA